MTAQDGSSGSSEMAQAMTVAFAGLALMVFLLGFAAPVSGAGYYVPAAAVSAIASQGFIGLDLLFVCLGVFLAGEASVAQGRRALLRRLLGRAAIPFAVVAGALVLAAAAGTSGSILVTSGLRAAASAALAAGIVVGIGTGAGFATRLFEAAAAWLIAAAAVELLLPLPLLGGMIAADHAPAVVTGLLLHRFGRRRADRSEQMLLMVAAVATTAFALAHGRDVGLAFGIAPRPEVTLILMPALLLVFFLSVDVRRRADAGGSIAGAVLTATILVTAAGPAVTTVLAKALPATSALGAAILLALAAGLALEAGVHRLAAGRATAPLARIARLR